MSNWNHFFLKIIRVVHLFFDRWFYWIGRKLKIGNNAPITVFAYRGYGRKDYLFLQGRVLKEKLIDSQSTDSDWRDFRNNIRRLWSVEIRNADLEITIENNTFQVTTDKEGFFILDTPLGNPLPNNEHLWHKVTVKLISIPWKGLNLKVFTEVLVPRKARMGVISDMDDTVIRTEVTSALKFKMFYLTLLKNASKRNAIPAVAAFFQALIKGKNQNQENPLFYVSNGPWNLYDLLEEFLLLNQLPLGPLLLRDFGLPYRKRPKQYKGHKHEHITRILDTYPELGFLLIGDSGEKDIDLYLRIARNHPTQIKGIYIRDVNNNRRRKRIKKIMEENQDLHIVLTRDYNDAAEDAASMGWLNLAFFRSICSA